MSDFAETRQWWPNDLVDEVMPPGRATPQAWLSPDASGVTTIHADNDDDKTALASIQPGSEVEFLWYENRGSAEILLMPDGTWSLADPRDGGTVDMFAGEAAKPTPPAARIKDANWFAAADDYETMMDSVDGFAECYAEMEPDIDPEGLRLPVDTAYWSDPVRFRISADGKSLEISMEWLEAKLQAIREAIGKPWANTVRFISEPSNPIVARLWKLGGLLRTIVISIGVIHPSGWSGPDKVYYFDPSTSTAKIIATVATHG